MTGRVPLCSLALLLVCALAGCATQSSSETLERDAAGEQKIENLTSVLRAPYTSAPFLSVNDAFPPEVGDLPYADFYGVSPEALSQLGFVGAQTVQLPAEDGVAVRTMSIMVGEYATPELACRAADDFEDTARAALLASFTGAIDDAHDVSVGERGWSWTMTMVSAQGEALDRAEIAWCEELYLVHVLAFAPSGRSDANAMLEIVALVSEELAGRISRVLKN